MKLKIFIMAIVSVTLGLVPTAAETNESIPHLQSASVVAFEGSPSLAPSHVQVTGKDTGDYEYICQMPDGNSWSLQVGEDTTDCHGSYLQKYINGEMVANYPLAYGGGAANEAATGCILALAGDAVLLLFPEGTASWVLASFISAAGTYDSCKA